MARRIHSFDAPDRFVAGTIGPPGERTFFLQVHAGQTVASVTLEKTQVAALAAHLGELLEALEVASEPSVPADESLEEPLGELFRVGAIALAWDPAAERIMIEAQPLDEEGEYPEVPDEDPSGPDIFRVRLTPSAARAFVSGAERVIAGGRPLCPFCGMPLEPTGHFCPRSNGKLN
jgi:uncharacterized repeat protein (TIGR03847 family)